MTNEDVTPYGRDSIRPNGPVEISESIKAFMADYPEPSRTAFIMMDFAATGPHNTIRHAIRSTLKAFKIHALRADDKAYHSDLYWNVITHAEGCSFGIAVLDRILGDEQNPNVALEVGYMLALGKKICLLKEKGYELQADLIGKLWNEFNPCEPATTISQALRKWMADKGIIGKQFAPTEYKILNTLWINQLNKFGRPGHAFTFQITAIASDYLEAREHGTPLMALGLIREENGFYMLTPEGFDFCLSHYREFPSDHWFDAEVDKAKLRVLEEHMGDQVLRSG